MYSSMYSSYVQQYAQQYVLQYVQHYVLQYVQQRVINVRELYVDKTSTIHWSSYVKKKGGKKRF